MTKDETREAIKVMQAFVDGTEIEYFSLNKIWEPAPRAGWNWIDRTYRIKKTPRTFWVYPVSGEFEWGVTDQEGENWSGKIKVQEVIE